MGIRSLKRQIAKGRLDAMGMKATNKKVAGYGVDGRKCWKAALEGKTGEAAHAAQMTAGKKKAQAERSKKIVARRVLKKV